MIKDLVASQKLFLHFFHHICGEYLYKYIFFIKKNYALHIILNIPNQTIYKKYIFIINASITNINMTNITLFNIIFIHHTERPLSLKSL